MREFYPIFLDLTGRRAVVIGGGPVAERKALSLLAAGAEVAVVSPELTPGLAGLAANGKISHEKRKYKRGDLSGAFIAVAATDDPHVNTAASLEAAASGVLINSVRPPGAGNFIVPSSIQKGGLTLAVSTGGGCPALTKKIRKDLEDFLGEGYGPFLEFLGHARTALKERMPDENLRAEALTALVESGLIDAFRTKDLSQARAEGNKMLDSLIAGKS